MDKFSGSSQQGKSCGNVGRRIGQQQREDLMASSAASMARFWAALDSIPDGPKVEVLDAGTCLQKFRLKR